MSQREEFSWEPLSPTAAVRVSRSHRFNTDTILLADFSMPRRGEACADLGTGCGVIPLLWALRAQPRAVWGVELQQEAAALAKQSVEYNKLENLIKIIQSDLRDREQLRRCFAPGSLDRMACNPPYKQAGAGVESREESQRLARHEASCTFGDIAAAASYFLRWGGKFCCCQRPERLPALMADLQACGLEPKRLRLVQQRPQKAPFLFLLEAVRGGRPGLRAEPTLLVEGPCGGWSQEMLDIYGAYKENHKIRGF